MSSYVTPEAESGPVGYILGFWNEDSLLQPYDLGCIVYGCSLEDCR